MNISKPEVVCNESIHPGWIKACYYLGIKVNMIKINEKTGKSPLNEWIKKINKNTIGIFMTTSTYPHGVID